MSIVFGSGTKPEGNQEDQEYAALAAALNDVIQERAELERGEKTPQVHTRLGEIEELRQKIRSVMDAMG
jgi:hypothetical protein